MSTLDKKVDWDRVMEKQRESLSIYCRWDSAIRTIDERAARESAKLSFSTPLWDYSPSRIELTRLQMDREMLGESEELNQKIDDVCRRMRNEY